MSIVRIFNARKGSIASTSLALALLAACGDADADPAAGIVFDTLDNGAVHVRNPETGIWPDGEGWRLVEELRIGAMDGDGPDVFGQVRGIEADEDERIYVLDHQAHAVRIFDADGGHIRTLGREGEGPGEFQSAFGLRFDPAGRLWVADSRGARYTLFDRDGSLLETYPRPLRSFGYIWEGDFDGDRLIEGDVVRDPDGESSRVLIRFDREMEPVDTLPVPEYEREFYHIQDPRGFTRMAAAVPFSPEPHRVLGPEGHLWTAVNDQYSLHLETLEAGDTVRIIERDYAPVPVTREERDEALDSEFLERMRDEGGDVDPGRVPDHKAAFAWFVTDDRDHLWVRATDPAEALGSRFDVFDSEGRLLGTVATDVEISRIPNPVIRGDRMYSVVTDDFDVPYVVRFRIEGREAEG